uniref:Uncharacterized protein n=1 Tax=Ditylum brightwellii TaxID=49249 RepID=A0A7S4VKM6_9STRA|mmetsp:Transcript_37694/g.50030  ORF Transcript_37694/g.50030 Transcript_37694/m.50030 type:complete len:275 (+) Transcript_37694:30-854(+)
MADDEIDEQQICKVYEEDDAFTAFVQFLLAAMALGSLWIKRQQERPRRKFLTWFLDMSKQGFGATYSHIMNMWIAAIIASNPLAGEVVLEDECAWYAINYVIDTTLGLFLSLIFLRMLDSIANTFNWTSLKESGVYVGATGLRHWFAQLFAWIFILSITKIIICYLMLYTSQYLAYVGDVLFSPLQGNIRFELLFVMIVFPGLCNIIYFWIVDTYLKAESHHKGAHEEEEPVATENDGKDIPFIDQAEQEKINTQDQRIENTTGEYDAPRPTLV